MNVLSNLLTVIEKIVGLHDAAMLPTKSNVNRQYVTPENEEAEYFSIPNQNQESEIIEELKKEYGNLRICWYAWLKQIDKRKLNKEQK